MVGEGGAGDSKVYGLHTLISLRILKKKLKAPLANMFALVCSSYKLGKLPAFLTYFHKIDWFIDFTMFVKWHVREGRVRQGGCSQNGDSHPPCTFRVGKGPCIL